MRTLRVLIAAILMVALCSVGSAAFADETSTDSTSTPSNEPSPEPTATEPTPSEPAPSEPTPSEPAPSEPTPSEPAPADQPTDPAPSPNPDPTPAADPSPKNGSTVVPPAPKSSKKKTAALAAADAFAVDDEYTVAQDSVSTLLDPSVTTNDTGINLPSGFTHTNASHGLVVNPSGGIAAVYNYAPFPGYFGDDTFTYTFTGTDDLPHTATVTIHVTATPGAPQAVDDEYTVAQDSGATLLNPSVAANDVGIPDFALFSSSPASNGTVTSALFSSNYSYTPNPGFSGDDTFTYAFFDEANHPHNATVTIHVTPVALISAAVDDEYTVAQDSGPTILNPDVTANDTGVPAGAPFMNTQADHGQVTSSPFAHDFVYVPSPGFSGDDSFTYTFIGTDGFERMGTVTIHVTAVTPHAGDDEYTVAQNSGATLLNPPVTLNDSNAMPLTFLNTPASHGTVTSTTFFSDYSYTPNPGFSGDDTFTYSFLGTNFVTQTATVTIHVTPVVASAAVDDEYTVAQDSGATLLAPDVSANDTGVAGMFTNTPASHGTVTSTPLSSDYSYTPNAGFSGDDTFTYTYFATDIQFRTATVTIHVTPTGPGSVANDDEYTIDQDSGPSLLNVTANDSGISGDFTNTPASHGSLVDGPDDNYFYTPGAGFFGDDTFTYTFTGTDLLPHTATVTIHVTPTPSSAVNDEYTVAQDSGATLLSPDVTANDTGATGDFSHTAAGDGTVTSTTDGHDFSYTPDAGFFGGDTFTYTFTGTDLLPHTATVTIHVTPTPVTSAAVDDEYTVAQDSGPTLLNPDVTANDTAVLGVFGNTPAGHGTVTSTPLSSDYSYTPNAGFSGDDTFTYTFTGTDLLPHTATVTIHVTPTPVTSAAVDDDYTVAQDSAATVLSPDVTLNDTGINALPMYANTAASHGTVNHSAFDHDYSYTPDAGFSGDDTFTYTFTGTDLLPHTATVTIHVTPTPVTSAAVDDEYTVAQDSGPNVLLVTANDSGISGNFSNTPAGHGTVTHSPGNDYTYAPDAGFHGNDTFTYTFDGTDGLPHTATVSVVVTMSPPVSSAADDDYTVAQDSGATLLSPDVTANDTNVGGSFSNLPAGHGTVTSSPGNHDYTYIPDAGFSGDDTFTYSFLGTDAVTRTATVTIHITPTPVTPVAVDDDYTVPRDQVTVLDPPVTDNDLGVPPGGIAPTIVNGPEHGTATVDASGDITYTPDDDFVGTDTFNYQLDTRPLVSKAHRAAVAAADSATVTLTVTSEASDPGSSTDPDDQQDSDDKQDLNGALPDTGSPIGSTELGLALLLILGGGLTVGFAQYLPRRRRHGL